MDVPQPGGVQPPIYITASALTTSSVSLDDAVRIAAAAGADGFELRSELLPAPTAGLDASTRQLLVQSFHGHLHFSTPVALFPEMTFNRPAVEAALATASLLDCALVKFAPGILPDPNSPEAGSLTAVLREWNERAPSLQITLENDQTPASGDPAQWARFLGGIRRQGARLGMTFDLGNWTCVGVDVEAAARLLAPHVVYIHAKAVARVGDQWASRPIRPASTMYPPLVLLPQEVARAIEFPVGGSTADGVVSALQRAISLLRSGRFVL